MLRFSRCLPELNWFATQLPSFYPNSVVLLCLILRDDCQRRWWHPTPVLMPGKSHGRRSLVGCRPWSRMRLSNCTFTFHFHALEKEMATHSSVLAWRIPGTGEPGGLPSMGSHRVTHDWSNLAAATRNDYKFFFFNVQVLFVLQNMLVKLTFIFF